MAYEQKEKNYKTMSNTINFILAVTLGISTLLGCKEKENEEPFVDENLINEWTLEWHENSDGSKIYEKPDDLPQDILLVFRLNNIVSGHVASFDIDGSYSIDKDGRLELFLHYPWLPICCQWDQYFLESYSQINSYHYDGGNYLKVYYENNSKVMIFSK